jgi:hypothetical protein
MRRSVLECKAGGAAMKRFILVPGLLLAVGIYSPAQENPIAPGESLVVEGVPRIPASLAEAIGR